MCRTSVYARYDIMMKRKEENWMLKSMDDKKERTKSRNAVSGEFLYYPNGIASSTDLISPVK